MRKQAVSYLFPRLSGAVIACFLGAATCLVGPAFSAKEGNGAPSASPASSTANLSDEEIRKRVGDLQKQLDELKALLNQKQGAQPAAPSPGPESPKPAAKANPVTTAQKFRFGGFVQLRAFDDQTTTNGPKSESRVDQFNVRRARLEFTGDLGKAAGARLTFDVGGTAVSAKDAYLEVKADPALFRLGQFKIPFDYEILQPAAELMALERSLANQRLFPGNRDRGVMVDVDLAKELQTPVSLKLGVVNGTGQNQNDKGGSKDVFATLAYTRPRLQGLISGLAGRFEFTPTGGATIDTPKRRFGVSLHGMSGDWDFHGQYTTGHGDFPQGGGAPLLTGKLGPTEAYNNKDVDGWYAMASRKLRDTPFTLWSKYESFDPDTDTGGDAIHIGALGALYDVNPQLRFSLGLYRKSFQAVPDDTTFGFQSQVKF